MLSLSSLIEFLLDMLRDEATQQDFARDPSATLAARGLSGVTAQDIRDVQPMLADVGGVQRVAHEPGHHAAPVHSHAFAGTHAAGGGSGGGHDVVREIHHVTHEYTVARPGHARDPGVHLQHVHRSSTTGRSHATTARRWPSTPTTRTTTGSTTRAAGSTAAPCRRRHRVVGQRHRHVTVTGPATTATPSTRRASENVR